MWPLSVSLATGLASGYEAPAVAALLFVLVCAPDRLCGDIASTAVAFEDLYLFLSAWVRPIHKVKLGNLGVRPEQGPSFEG